MLQDLIRDQAMLACLHTYVSIQYVHTVLKKKGSANILYGFVSSPDLCHKGKRVYNLLMLMLADRKQSEESYRLLVSWGVICLMAVIYGFKRLIACMTLDLVKGLLTHIMRQGDSHCYHLLFALLAGTFKERDEKSRSFFPCCTNYESPYTSISCL